MAEEACCAVVSLDSLPGPALQLVDQFVGRGWSGTTPLLRTCRALRDTVFAGSKSISLTLRNYKRADMAAHRRLLRRACATASPGLNLKIRAPEAHPSSGKHLLCSLLKPVKDEGFPNVHGLMLQVSW
jgi:hypothetical protein